MLVDAYVALRNVSEVGDHITTLHLYEVAGVQLVRPMVYLLPTALVCLENKLRG